MAEQIKDVLKKFLSQAKTDDLKTSHFPKKYAELSLKVSFGQGNAAKIPWISFLGAGQTTSNGIYPVFLLFKKYGTLILAYGVSEENEAGINWPIDANVKTVATYMAQTGRHAERYGSSYVYRAYDLKREINWENVEEDLDSLIDQYKGLISVVPDQKVIELDQEEFDVHNLSEKFVESSYFVQKTVIVRFVASLLTKPFVILTGLSGSGKTKLAMAFSKWICEDGSQICVVPVGADWTNREPILGFPNALEYGKYVMPENGALNLIIEASREENRNKPYFLILDEMNLSHVERYFADFLSAMESGEPIPLHVDATDWKDGVPGNVVLPANLFIIGTVNIDETTYMFSPKVLDRANVIEFRVTEEEMEKYLKSRSKLAIDELKGAGGGMAASFVSLARANDLDAVDLLELESTLISFFKELKKSGAEFGYRTAAEIMRFAAAYKKIESNSNESEIIDAVIMQKLLPKVHGSRRKLEPVLRTLATLCLAKDESAEAFLTGKAEIEQNKEGAVKYPISLEKIVRMYDNLMSNGFTSYAEA